VQARALLRGGGDERPCVAYRVDARGEVMFRKTVLDRVGVALASAALMVAAGCVGFDELEIEVPDPELELDVDDYVAVPSCEPEPQPPTSTPVPKTFELPTLEPSEEPSEIVMGNMPRRLVEQERAQQQLEHDRLLQLEREALEDQAREREWVDSIPDDDESLQFETFETLGGSLRLGRAAPRRFVRLHAIEQMMELTERESPK
jgi:hypothetical protein